MDLQTLKKSAMANSAPSNKRSSMDALINLDNEMGVMRYRVDYVSNQASIHPWEIQPAAIGMENQLRELIPFMRDRNPAVRQIALSNLLGQTPKDAPYRTIFFQGLQGGGLQEPQETDIIRDLKLLCRDELAIAHDAFRALVNLSDSPLLVPFLSEPSFLTFLVSYILNPDAILADLASMLLSNLTSSSSTCAALLSLRIQIVPSISATYPIPYHPIQSRSATCSVPVLYPPIGPQQAHALSLLVEAFAQGVPNLDSERVRKGDLHFLSSVFANISASPSGSLFFLTPRPRDETKPKSAFEYPLSRIMPFTEHPDVVRRRGVASTIKNCTFHASAHQAILSPDTDKVFVPPSITAAPGIEALPYILLPLAGPEELDLEAQEKMPSALQFLPPSKKRERDPVLRQTHVETLLLLCTTRWGRDFLRANGVYEIIRAAHLEETVDKVSEHIERLVQLIKGVEGREIVDDSAIISVKECEDSDEDNKIEEV